MYTKYARLRDDREVTDYRVAKETGIATSTLSAWKAGFYRPKIDKLILLAQYFDVPVDYFLEEEEEETLPDYYDWEERE